jgi:membrane associated rhomboid family serine protease
MLDAVGISSQMYSSGPLYLLAVPSPDAARALEHLSQYEIERRPAPPPPPPLPAYPYAWLGCVVYAAVLTGVALAIANGLGRLDAFSTGELDAGSVQAGQWWRAWTALTLHLDGTHLMANLVAGCWFGYLAGRQLGAGHAWFLAVTGAAGANLLEALLGPATHRAVGASTAVFTALGILSAYAWRTRRHHAQRWALQWAPLVGGLVLLSWTGSGGENAGEQVDVVAHALGFLTGVLLGALAAQPRLQQALTRLPQWVTGLAAVAQIAVAWGFALGS